MTRMSALRRLLAAALAIGMAAGVAALAPAQASPVGTASTAGRAGGDAELVWRRCQGDLECARLRVPLDHDDPAGPTIGIALVRRQSSGARPPIGSIIVNPGGPGGSGVGFVAGAGDRLFTPRVRARFDIVGFDPRGIARSTPLECFRSQQAAIDALAPFAFPYTDRQEQTWVNADERVADACARRGGAILGHMSTANVARDIDLIRAALGERRTSYYGVSYGSMIGSTYAAMFPDRVRALVIDSVIDPVAWTTGRGDQAESLSVDARLRSEQGAYDSLQQFLARCDQVGDRCAFSPGDPRRRYAALARQLREDPVRVPGFGRISYQTMVAISLGSMYSSRSWPFFARFLRLLDQESSPQRVAAALRELDARVDLTPTRATTQVLEGTYGVTCNDSDNPDTVEAWDVATAAADRRDPYFGRLWGWASSVCRVWPGGVDEDRFTGPWDAPTANPVLAIGTRFDPATRYRDAVTTTRLLADARLLTLEGTGHTTLGHVSSCVDDYLETYLLRREVPPRGATCRLDRQPFAR